MIANNNTGAFPEQTIEINGISLSYTDTGGEGLALILLHAFPFDKRMWREQIPFLSREHRVIAPDLRGFGKSTRGNDPASMELYASDVIALMNHLKVDKAVLCGLSMGGYIALAAVSKFAFRFSGLILCNTHCAADTEDQVKIRQENVCKLRQEGTKKFSEDFLKNLYGDSGTEFSECRRIIGEQTVETLSDALQAMSRREETCSSLNHISIPVLIIAGDQDKVVTRSRSELLYSKLPHAKLEFLENTGHLSNLESPSKFNTLIKSFLESVQRVPN